MGIWKKIKRLFCKHNYEIVRKVEKFSSLRGEQLYKRCTKCGKVVPYIYREYEGGGYR